MDVPRCYRVEIRPGESAAALSPEARFLALLGALQEAGLDFEVLADDSRLWTDPDDPGRCVAVTLIIAARPGRPPDRPPGRSTARSLGRSPDRLEGTIDDVIRAWAGASDASAVAVTSQDY